MPDHHTILHQHLNTSVKRKGPHLLGSSRSSSAAICFWGGGVGGRNVEIDVGVADVGWPWWGMESVERSTHRLKFQHTQHSNAEIMKASESLPRLFWCPS